MSAENLPPVVQSKFNRQKFGYFGELGNGANACIKFLQSAVTKDELDNITLIENISGSERWNIQDLFQRDVDLVRVEESILPYLKDSTKVKFFNPLTLVLLPIDAAGNVDSDVLYINPKPVQRGGHHYTCYERDGLFSYDVHNVTPAFSELRWNDTRVKLVAIDGQHRLSALKYWKGVPGPKDLDTWQIPVVILGIFKSDDNAKHKPANLLEIVRKTFVFINQRAEQVNEARRILLDDEEVEAVCTQEIVQASHTNDCKTPAAIDPEQLPLLFFDWRGQMKWRKKENAGVAVVAPGSVLSIEELYGWLKEYILISGYIDTVLELEDLSPPLSENYLNANTLTFDDTVRIRKQFNKIILPGVAYLLEQFAPYRSYVDKIRAMEKKFRKEAETAAGYAFQKLRFGSHSELPGGMKARVDEKYGEIIDHLLILRSDCFDGIIDRDIGMRAVVYAFSALKFHRDDFSGQTGSWKEHAVWFVPMLNKVYKAGWFKSARLIEKNKLKILTHICFDPAGNIINYQIADVKKALGSLLALLIVKESLADFSSEQRDTLWDDFGDSLETPLKKGFRREVTAELSPDFVGTAAQLKAKILESLLKRVSARQKLIRSLCLP